jgi:hypothetical protein
MKINLFTSLAAHRVAPTAAGASQSVTQPRTLAAVHAREANFPFYEGLNAGNSSRMAIDIDAIKNCQMVDSYDLEDWLDPARQLCAQ